jgi:hypothetical protein
MMLNPLLGITLFCFASLGEGKVQRVAKRACLRQGYNTTIYEYEAPDFWKTENITLSKYEGKVIKETGRFSLIRLIKSFPNNFLNKH